MKAAVVTDFRSPLQVKDLPTPEPGPGEVLVRIESSGLCHTDIHAAHGDWPVKPTPPFVPGHEGVGHRREAGSGGDAHGPSGDRVAIAWLGYACGQCRYCIGGWETLCEQQHNSGYSVNGAFAEYAVAPADFATPVPDGISSRDAAPLTCAGVTTYKAIKVAGTGPSRDRRGLRRRRARSPRPAVRADRRRLRRRRRRRGRQARAGHRARRRPRRQRPRRSTRSRRSRTLGGADVAVALAASPAVVRPGVPLAAPRRPTGLRGAARATAR